MAKRIVLFLLAVATTLLWTTLPAASAPAPTITLLNEPPAHLAVGESFTLDVLVMSEEPFILALALPAAYYPGRGVLCNDGDRATHATSAVLHVTITGQRATADLPAVTDWPDTEDWPPGVAPVSLVVGVRYGKGRVFSERFNFAVAVP